MLELVDFLGSFSININNQLLKMHFCFLFIVKILYLFSCLHLQPW